jgi:hypothetical protein
LNGRYADSAQNEQGNCFRFEARWLQEEACDDLVKKAWGEAFMSGATDVKEGLKGVAGVLSDWNRNVLGDLEKRIKKLKELAVWLEAPDDDESIRAQGTSTTLETREA